jgi:hypothetical protein
MKIMIQSGRVLGIVVLFVVGAILATVSNATDCYRYVSGDETQIQLKDSCIQQLNITPIFVRLTEEGYDLLIPTSSEQTTAPNFMRAAAAAQWLSQGDNLASTQAVVDALVLDPEVILPLGWSRVEQINYTLATWLNTSGATSSITSLASNIEIPPTPNGSVCQIVPQCGSCERYWCVPDAPCCPGSGYCNCTDWGWTCCVIGKRLQAGE